MHTSLAIPFALLTSALVPSSVADAPGGEGEAPEDPIPAMLAKVSPERIMARVEKLVSFHTRHTWSETESDERGIGAARRWIQSDLDESAKASGGRLQVGTQSAMNISRRGGEREFEVVNVYGFLPGTQGDPKGRTYVVSGHYDSICGDPRDAESFAPGADDDASGTAVVLELARVMSAHEFEANIIFICVAGEEQGLYGSKNFLDHVQRKGIAVDGFFTNDIVGGVEGGDGTRDDKTVRCFSAAEGLHSESRELARLVHETAKKYVPDANVKLVFRLDRFGRGGDHKPFHDAGLPALRFTEANEHYARQHEDVREEEGVQYGDLPEFVSPEYTALVARVNGAALAQLALAPAPPSNLRGRGAVRYDTTLSWDASPSKKVAGYIVVWRDTASPVWEHQSELIEGTRTVVEGVRLDEHFFAVRAVSASGHVSRAIYSESP